MMKGKTPEDEHDELMSMSSEEVRAELKSRGIDTTNAVSYVLQRVREAKAKRAKYRAEMN